MHHDSSCYIEKLKLNDVKQQKKIMNFKKKKVQFRINFCRKNNVNVRSKQSNLFYLNKENKKLEKKYKMNQNILLFFRVLTYYYYDNILLNIHLYVIASLIYFSKT
jgi:hypothetical protein